MNETTRLSGLLLEDIAIRNGDQTLLRISAHVPPGAVLSIMGPSGAGKSTLLSLIAGFVAPDFTAMGRIFLHGTEVQDLPPQSRRAGLLFQDALLYPHLSVRENLLFALPRGGTGKKRRQQAEDALEAIGLAGFAMRDPATLSGGQKTRVAIARMLLSDPLMLLLDEPFANLDRDLKQQIRSLVFDLAAARKLPVVLATHDKDDAEAAGGEIIRLDGLAM